MDKVVSVRTYPNEMEARLAAGVLEDAGIGCVVQPLGFGYGGVGMTQFIHHRVLVAEDRVERAREVLGVSGG